MGDDIGRRLLRVCRRNFDLLFIWLWGLRFDRIRVAKHDDTEKENDETIPACGLASLCANVGFFSVEALVLVIEFDVHRLEKPVDCGKGQNPLKDHDHTARHLCALDANRDRGQREVRATDVAQEQNVHDGHNAAHPGTVKVPPSRIVSPDVPQLVPSIILFAVVSP